MAFHTIVHGALLLAAGLALAACGGEKPRDALKPLRPGEWRVSTLVDHSRAGVGDSKAHTVVTLECVTDEPQRPGAIRLAIHLGCTGPVRINADGQWNFTETCSKGVNTVTEGMVWGRYDRAYLIERVVTTTDADDPTIKHVARETVNAVWKRSTCGPTAAKR